MAQEFIKNPTETVRALLKIDVANGAFSAGRLAMALEVVTVIRTLEEIPSIMQPRESAVVISVLQTFLVDQGFDWCYRTYDELSASRRPTFVPEPSLSSIADADGPYVLDPQRGPVFADEVLPGAASPVDALRALSVVRQNRDDVTSDEQLELTAEVDEETLTE